MFSDETLCAEFNLHCLFKQQRLNDSMQQNEMVEHILLICNNKLTEYFQGTQIIKKLWPQIIIWRGLITCSVRDYFHLIVSENSRFCAFNFVRAKFTLWKIIYFYYFHLAHMIRLVYLFSGEWFANNYAV